MNVFKKTYYLFLGILIKLFPSLGYKGVVDTQIKVHNKLKRKYPKALENDLLNSLIISRIKAPPRVDSKEQEYTHYRSLLNNSDKTLRDVIWEIVNYEYLESRKDFLEKSVSPEILIREIAEVKQYIKESVNKTK